MKTKKIYRPEDPEFVMKPIIMDIAYRLNSLEIGGDEIAALEWLAGTRKSSAESCARSTAIASDRGRGVVSHALLAMPLLRRKPRPR